MLGTLKSEVCAANLALMKYGLVTLTWGNVSGISRSEGLVVIKPSGVDYADLTPAEMVVLDMDGKAVDGKLKPSSDTATHLELYKAFPEIGGVSHTHSEYATMFAQACRELPCYGTTHADHFNGTIPVTRFMNENEVAIGYERNTGKVIVERFRDLDPMAVPAVLVAGHGPFSWGRSAPEAVENSLVLETIAKLAIGSRRLNPGLGALPDYIVNKHYQRKHGANASYGQK